MPNFTNAEVAARLEQVATLMRLCGMNEFKAIAFDKAARTIENLEIELAKLVQNKEVETLKGIGKSIAGDIYQLFEEGEMGVLQELGEKIPEGLLKWLDISGLGPKKIFKIHKELGISKTDELQAACEDGRVAALSGMGKKSAEKILKSIEWRRQHAARCRIDEALDIAVHFREKLDKLPEVQGISVAGSLRRSRETIGDIDLLVAAEEKDSTTIFDAFVAGAAVTEILGRGDTKCSIRSNQGRQVDVRIVNPAVFGAALMYFTGSKEHNVVMRGRARERGMALNEYGLFKLNENGETDFDALIVSAEERDIFEQLDLQWIPPERREDGDEFQAYGKERPAPALLEASHIKGVVHAHSTWSDGKFSIEEMARACHQKGYSYLGISDHSRSAAYAGGLSMERVKQQWKEIEALNTQFDAEGVDFRVFKSIESDILLDGSLDYPEEILAGFDFVIASVHSSLDMDSERMLERFQRAVDNPYCRMLGHPTGRILLRRDGNAFDMNALIDYAAEKGVAIEINASPYRLDLDWRYGRKARSVNLMTSINPDAHHTDGIGDIKYGVGIARKAGFTPGYVMNALSRDDFAAWCQRERIM